MILLWLAVVAPVVAGLAIVLLPSARAVLGGCIVASVIEAGLVAALVPYGARGEVLAAGQQLRLDPLSTYHLVLVIFVFALSSFYAWSYFAPRVRDGSLGRATARRFGACWSAFLASMVLVLTANNVGLMWVAMEATTLASGLLVCLEFDRAAVRAAWTYLLICSVGIALALLGTFVLCGAARQVMTDQDPLLWTDLVAVADRLPAGAAKFAFIFLLVGYGTKAGLAPLHTWLPDAHGQAPTPVSAVLSGVLLNCALYAVSRFLPIVDAATGHSGWGTGLLIPFGLLSIVLAAAFIVHEHDVKRLLAFHSVEHLGIIALGLGVGGAAAALYHTFNHSVCKMLTFFCAGKLVQRYGTQDMRAIRGALGHSPLAGGGLLLGILALVGLPPFSIFMSELWIARQGLRHDHPIAVAVFLLAAAVVFVAAVRHAVEMTQPSATPPAGPPASRGVRLLDLPLVVVPLALLVVVGVWLPGDLRALLDAAAAVIEGGP